MSTSAVAAATVQIRALQPADLDAVVAIDAAIEGRTRRDYIERRLRSAQKQPLLHAQFAAMQGDQLVGYLLGRLASGEFGRRAPALRIELVGLRPEHSRRGVGRALFDALLRWGGRHGASEIRTLSNWTRSDMLGWLAGLGFEPHLLMRQPPNTVFDNYDCTIHNNAEIDRT